MQHVIFLKSLDGKLYLAPIPRDVQHVLDVGEFCDCMFGLLLFDTIPGTGTGVWGMDFGLWTPFMQRSKLFPLTTGPQPMSIPLQLSLELI
jgi:hypothetical protein